MIGIALVAESGDIQKSLNTAVRDMMVEQKATNQRIFSAFRSPIANYFGVDRRKIQALGVSEVRRTFNANPSDDPEWRIPVAGESASGTSGKTLALVARIGHLLSRRTRRMDGALRHPRYIAPGDPIAVGAASQQRHGS